MKTDTLTRYTGYTAGKHDTSKPIRFLEAVAAWPTPTEIPATILAAVETVNAVMAKPLRADIIVTPEEYLSDAGDDLLDRAAIDGLVAGRRNQIRSQITRAAGAQLEAAIWAHLDALWEQVDESFAAVFNRLPELDLSAPGRLTADDYTKLSKAGKEQVDASRNANAVMRAVRGLAAIFNAPSTARPDGLEGEATRFATLDLAAWRRYKAGLGHLDGFPKDGSHILTWLARCGAEPSIARDRRTHEARIQELLERIAGSRAAARVSDIEHREYEQNVKTAKVIRERFVEPAAGR